MLQIKETTWTIFHKSMYCLSNEFKTDNKWQDDAHEVGSFMLILGPLGHLKNKKYETCLTRKSIPTVDIKFPERKAPSLKRTKRHVLPTPLSPISITYITRCHTHCTFIFSHSIFILCSQEQHSKKRCKRFHQIIR